MPTRTVILEHLDDLSLQAVQLPLPPARTRRTCSLFPLVSPCRLPLNPTFLTNKFNTIPATAEWSVYAALFILVVPSMIFVYFLHIF